MHERVAHLRLVENDRVADARARIYGRQLADILDAWDRSEQASADIPDFIHDLRSLADRMNPQTAAARPDMGAGNGRPQEVTR